MIVAGAAVAVIVADAAGDPVVVVTRQTYEVLSLTSSNSANSI